MKKLIQFKRLTWHLLNQLPSWLRDPIIRRQFRIERDLPEGLIIKKAETSDELEQAFGLVYEAYHESGLSKTLAHPIKVTKYHLLPTTQIFIAKLGDEVIATSSLIVDSGMGLPVEKHWDLKSYRRTHHRIAEVGALAVKRGHRRKRGKLILPLFRYLYEVSRYQMGIDGLVIMTHPAAGSFYSALLGFQPVEGAKTVRLASVQNAPAAAQFLSYPGFESFLKSKFKSASEDTNLLKFFTEPLSESHDLGAEMFPLASRKLMTAEQVEHFFVRHSTVLRELTTTEKTVIRNFYFPSEFRQFFELDGEASASFNSNRSPRLPVFVQGEILMPDGGTQELRILDLSETGIQGNMNKSLLFAEQLIRLRVKTWENEMIELRGQVRWINSDRNQIGLRLVSPPKSWSEFVNSLLTRLESEKLRAQKRG